MRVAIISLKRTPERWDAFLSRNQQALNQCQLLRVEGIDGIELLQSDIKSRLIATSARRKWSAGAIGIGLSHLHCWRLCSNTQSPLVVLEDDVILADDWLLQLNRLLHPEAGMMLLGWNLDSMLRSGLSDKQEIISLFEPAYPNEREIQALVNSREGRQRKPLRHAFGLPGYWINPQMAEQLLRQIKVLETLPLKLGRGFPDITTLGIDALLNLYYQQIKAEIVIPPIALALNDPFSSTTRGKPRRFGEKSV